MANITLHKLYTSSNFHHPHAPPYQGHAVVFNHASEEDLLDEICSSFLDSAGKMPGVFEMFRDRVLNVRGRLLKVIGGLRELTMLSYEAMEKWIMIKVRN
jgi:hypothetical protein